VIILIAEKAGALFSTIQSRAKRVNFFPLAPEEIGRILTDRYKLDGKRADLLSRISSGSVDKALRYNEENFFAKRGRIIDGLSSGTLPDADLDGLSKPDLRLVLDVILTWYRDVLVTKAFGLARPRLVNIDKAEAIRDGAKRLSFDGLENMINQVILTGSFLEENINPKLAMGMLGINLAHC
jgi:hypothetical protein